MFKHSIFCVTLDSLFHTLYITRTDDSSHGCIVLEDILQVSVPELPMAFLEVPKLRLDFLYVWLSNGGVVLAFPVHMLCCVSNPAALGVVTGITVCLPCSM